jgi:hypothetical protein
MSEEKYLGRFYDPKTMTWACADGSGRLPHEAIMQHRADVQCLGYPSGFGLLVAAANKEAWEGRLRRHPNPTNTIDSV